MIGEGVERVTIGSEGRCLWIFEVGSRDMGWNVGVNMKVNEKEEKHRNVKYGNGKRMHLCEVGWVIPYRVVTVND